MATAMRLRSATRSDLAAVSAWVASEEECRIWAGPQVHYPFTPESLAEDIGFGRFTTVVCDTVDNQRCAFGQMVRKTGDRIHLGRLIVEPGLRGRGLGRALVEHLLNKAVEMGAARISLNVYKANSLAVGLYRDLGFNDRLPPVDELASDDMIYMEHPAFNTFMETGRLLLCPWEVHHAEGLAQVLAVNQKHLSGWIPAHVSRSGTIPELEARIAGWRTDHETGRAFRWGIFEAKHRSAVMEDPLLPLGEISLFPRTEDARTRISEADRLEIGYWLRNDATGKGYATEAIRAIPGLATPWLGLTTLEIRCDPANAPSVAVARRLGFHLTHESPTDMIWQS